MRISIFDWMVVHGREHVFWYHLPVDAPEWTLPRYYHQN